MEYTFFYGGPFSQWYHCLFTVDGVQYQNAEQYMMAGKAKVFNDNETLKLIMNSPDPRTAKKLGRCVKCFNSKMWDTVSRDVVYKGNYAKFTQNPDLYNALMETKGTLLVEASPTDCLWGIGLDQFDEKVNDRSQWRGVNWLGEVLTKLREDLIQGVKTEENFGWSQERFIYDKPPPV